LEEIKGNFPEADFWTAGGITSQSRTETHLSGYGVNQDFRTCKDLRPI